MKNKIVGLFSMILMPFLGYTQTWSKETIEINTNLGTMKVKLFEETPLHKNNFLKLVKAGFYDSLLFHRVINNFMIQGGDPDSKTANDTALLGNADVGYWIPSEFNPKIYHKKGRLCAARENDDVNPKKESSGCQFYIVMGKKHDSISLKKAEIRVNKELVSKINYTRAFSGKSPELKRLYTRLLTENKQDSLNYHVRQLNDDGCMREYLDSARYMFSKQQQKDYFSVGGTPHLDNNYTVFGEVIEGLEVIDKISAQQTDKNDRPLKNIRMKIRVTENKK
ncbi:MAG: peptidylprolyl isomerase [Sphingobacteriaceae bacterium]|nr:peptidylprolyl isomerase [Sphingobacteriaceae bacterium]